ncbi:MAG: segregation/condensation protein A [Clostridiales bacterium]|nr:segregation/condensation protein A [Clostridiales bacterium]
MAISIKLEVFEGPLDLLFHLIEKAKIDIYDIPIAEITEQYIDYLNMMKEMDIDLASEFLVMAATLLIIKSKMLLPKTPMEEENYEDPREELVIKLLEYKKFKEVSELLKDKYLRNENLLFKDSDLADALIDSYELPDEISVELLIEKFQNILIKKEKSENREHKRVYKDSITVEEKIAVLLDILTQKRWTSFDGLLQGCDNRLEVIISFLALLELIKGKKIRAKQEKRFGSILLKKV